MSDRIPENHLDVYDDRFELFMNGENSVYYEGFQNTATQRRYEKITNEFEKGYLQAVFDGLAKADFSAMSDNNKKLLKHLVEGITSEVGRALVGVAFLQLAIKSITPEQCIRLHKGTTRRGSFSWVEGISMRTLDLNYSTPFLREHGLLNVNKFGVFMTRSLAENYPYTTLYKAEMRGPFNHWIKIVDALESNELPAKEGLMYLMALLKNRSDTFQNTADQAIRLVEHHRNDSFESISMLLSRFFNETSYSARAFEVTMHGFMQALQEMHLLGDCALVEMSQMRSANKKHGNVGDIELREGRTIVEAWDGKYGKPYLRDEIEELYDKLLVSPGVRTAGFVVDSEPDCRREIVQRVKEIETMTGVDIHLMSFDSWLKWQIEKANPIKLNELAYRWLRAVVESFGQRRLEIAPIDEPCDEWLNDLIKMMK